MKYTVTKAKPGILAAECEPGKVYMCSKDGHAYLCGSQESGWTGKKFLVALEGTVYPVEAFPTVRFTEVRASAVVEVISDEE